MIAAPAIARPFDSRPLGRLFWKEYRQQKTLWVGMLVFGLALQMIARIVAAVSPFLSGEQRDAMVALWAIPLYLAAFFLIGSTAMLFALEREERTSGWLLSLSASPWSTLLAKYGFAIVAAVSLPLVMWPWAAVLSVGSGFEFRSFVPESVSLGWAVVRMLSVVSVLGAGILLWGALGSLTSQRVVAAVPMGILWANAIILVPLASVHYWFWFRYGPLNSGGGWREQIDYGVVVAGFLATAALNVIVGLRWCRGQYLDASLVSELNDRLMEMLPWRRVRSSRVPVAIESEHAGWRTWQRLVWQERHRESLHTGLLWIGCAAGVLLAIFSLGLSPSDRLTFAVTPIIVALPLAMGVLGFRFDAGGQQLRFLANRGTSPAMIWLAKHVVWLPRAFWIPAVCWAVACLAEWAFLPWAGTGSLQSFLQRRHFVDVVGFVLMSYAVGQAAAMLFRRMILAIGVGLLATIALASWQTLVVESHLPRWWSVGGIAVWLVWLTGWYSRHWLIERRGVPVLKRLAVGLTLPPLLLLIGAALYRWLEVPGFGPSSPTLLALLYPREAERRHGDNQLNEIRAAVKQVSQPTSPESRAVRQRLTSTIPGASPDFMASLPAGASPEDREHAAKSLEAIIATLTDEQIASFRIQRSADFSPIPNPELLNEAGRLSAERGDPTLALRYFVASLRLARCFVSQGQFSYWRFGSERQAETLKLLVEWSNHEDVSRELLIAAINQSQVELARFPTLREASVSEFVWEEGWMRRRMDQMDEDESWVLFVAKPVAATLFAHELARQTRINEQKLFWRWYGFGLLESLLRIPGINAHQQFSDWKEQIAGAHESEQPWEQEMSLWSIQDRFGTDAVVAVIDREAVNRQALLALAIVLWKKDHGGDMPDSLEDLAAYCVVDGRKEPGRVLPVMALNDPWTGGLFVYSRLWAKSNWAKDGLNPGAPVTIVRSAGATLLRDAATSVHPGNSVMPDMPDAPDMIVYTPDYSMSSSIQLQKLSGRLSLAIPRKGRR